MTISNRLPQDSVKGNNLYIRLGGRVIKHKAQAAVSNMLGTVIVNAAEGIMHQGVKIPLGVTAVNADYVLNYIEKNQDGRVIDEHEAGDNKLEIGPQATPYLIAPGIIFVKHGWSDAQFVAKPLERKEFLVPRNPNIHITEDEDIVIGSTPHIRGKDPRT